MKTRKLEHWLLIGVGVVVVYWAGFSVASRNSSENPGPRRNPSNRQAVEVAPESGRPTAPQHGIGGQRRGAASGRTVPTQAQHEFQSEEPQREEGVAMLGEQGLSPDSAKSDIDAITEALAHATVNADTASVLALVQDRPGSAQYVKQFLDLVDSDADDEQLRRAAAEALVRMGTEDTVAAVLDQALAAERSGDQKLASALISSLESLSTAEGARPVLDLLLGIGRYEGDPRQLPEDFREAARKALRSAPDQEGIGNLAAALYLDPRVVTNENALLELFDGLALPGMLSRLAVESFQAGSPEVAEQFLDRILVVEDLVR